MAFIAIGAVALTTAGAVALWHLRRDELPPPQVVTLVASRSTNGASFSPDGTQIAFGSAGETWKNWDVWLKIVGEPETRRLTSDPAADCCPAWSPDGKQIAFVRFAPGASTGTIHLVSPLGGPERRLSDLLVPQWPLTWSPDGRWLAAARKPGEATTEPGGVYLVSADRGEARQVTFAKPPTWDADPALSPDGRALAFFSCRDAGNQVCDLYVLGLDSGLQPSGPARPLPPRAVRGNGIAWTRDGRSILYGVFGQHLWRVRADGSAPPERVELAGRPADLPFCASGRDRLGFRRNAVDLDIHRFEVGGAGTMPVVTSTASEYQPAHSPDGRKIAFDSNREGDLAVWLADADGSNPIRFTHGPGRAQGSARWSPDGRRLLFDAQADDGHWDTWTIGVDGSGLRQVTRLFADHGPSSWSRDGRFIYFTSSRTGRHEVWRVAVADGREEQVTAHGGYLPFESADGRTLFYKRAEEDSPLLAMPSAGGEERTVLACVPFWGYAVGPDGVFHLECDRPGTDPLQSILRHWNNRTGRDQHVTTLPGVVPLGLSVSPDGQGVLLVHGASVADLMMIENFR